jgi:hypothetical protein
MEVSGHHKSLLLAFLGGFVYFCFVELTINNSPLDWNSIFSHFGDLGS